jgi:hypothetical protein
MDVLGTYKDEPVILQSKPQRRTISCLHIIDFARDPYDPYARDTYAEDTYFLQFPYIVFCQYPFDTTNLAYCYCRVGFSPEPISSLDAKIYLPPLPNTHCCGTFSVCGCNGDNVKISIEQFWQKRFKTGELLSGEISLCKMFDIPHYKSNIHTALRRWEKLNLVSFNERMLRACYNLSVGEFLEMSFILNASSISQSSMKLMF